MASLQAYQSHSIRDFRMVESFRNNGKPAIRMLAHLGEADDILRLHQQQQEIPFKISSVSAGAVTALYRLARGTRSCGPHRPRHSSRCPHPDARQPERR